jgi:HAD superfamily hydrolase (TIGR01509 family)
LSGSVGAVIFDLDGVLVDSFLFWLELMNRASSRFGSAPVTAAALRRSWGQTVHADAREFFRGVPAEEVIALYAEIAPMVVDAIEVVPGALEAVQAIDASGVATGVVTNTDAAVADLLLSTLDFVFEVVVPAGGSLSPKPAPDSLLYACASLAVSPAATVYVGDTNTDRLAALNAGTRFVGFHTEATVQIQHLAHLPAAIARVGNVPAPGTRGRVREG